MRAKETTIKKIGACLLAILIVFGAVCGAAETGAWFVDAGIWATANYAVGVIDYTVYIRDVDIEKFKNGQSVQLTVPIIGGGKINDAERPVEAVNSSVTGTRVLHGAHDEFDEAVTLVRTKVVNTGGLPMSVSVDVNGGELPAQGILYMVLPGGDKADTDQYTVNASGAGIKTYRTYLRDKLTAAGGAAALQTYDGLSAAVRSHHLGVTDGVLNSVVVRPGLLSPVPKTEVTRDSPGFEVEVLCWAEYDQMPWSDVNTGSDGVNPARNNGKEVESRSGMITLTIRANLASV